ncbi:MAG TPA: ComEC/Rec2 family competence protein [Dehalococcoidia bacterium]|nr:ComEC/Rec2 family competence protein [Dehalococcoidia bacterium]
MLLLLLVAAWLAGLLLGTVTQAPPIPLLLFALAALPLALLLRLLRRPLWPALLAGTMLLGLWRAETAEAAPALPASQDGQSVVLEGWVAGDPEATAQRIRFVLSLTALGEGGALRPAQGRVLVYADPPAALAGEREAPYFRYGDELRLQGQLERPQPFGDFDYPSYLAQQGISGVMWSSQAEWLAQGGGNPLLRQVFGVRRRLSQSLEAALPVPEAGLAQALLLGIRSGLPPGVVEDFRRTGASHLLAISGLQVSVLLALALGAAGGLLGKRRQLYLLLPLALVWAYALVSGLAPPVVRAAIMGSVYLAALGLGRPRSVLPALALAAAAMTAVHPRVLTDVSFQLSFAAVAGIALAAPCQDRFTAAFSDASGAAPPWWRRWAGRLLAGVAIAVVVSVAATLATLPLVAFNFHQVPLSGVFVTVLSLPVQALLLVGAGVTALGGLLHPALGEVFGWLAWAPLAYQIGLVSVAPGPVFSGKWAGPSAEGLMAVWYLALGAALLWPQGVRLLRSLPAGVQALATLALPSGGGPAQSRRWPLAFLGLALPLTVVGALLWARVLNAPDGNLHVYFFDVGQGDSTLVVTPGGRQVLVDGGPASESATRALSGPLSPWDRSLDLVVLTHLDADHAQGLLEVLERQDVGVVLVGGEDPDSSLFPQWRAVLSRRETPTVPVSAGYRVTLEEGLYGVYLEVLNPPAQPFQGTGSDRNNNGVVLRLVYGDTSFLLAADIEAAAEGRLARFNPQGLASQVLKVAHHGSQTSTTDPFLRAVDPALAVISVGESNRYGHPHPQVVSRLQSQVGEARLVRTDRQGTIEVISDGRSLWFKTGGRR